MSVFGESIQFLNKLGVYDVVLPFILVFTIVFAILDKTKILGTELGLKDNKEYTKKNLNSMIAFVVAFFVVASSQLVAVINKTMGQIFILMLLIISFLMLAGAFHEQSAKGFSLEHKSLKGYKTIMLILTGVGIIAIFMNALGWLDAIYNFLKDNWNASYVAAIIFIILIIGFMLWVTKDQRDDSKDKKEET